MAVPLNYFSERGPVPWWHNSVNLVFGLVMILVGAGGWAMIGAGGIVVGVILVAFLWFMNTFLSVGSMFLADELYAKGVAECAVTADRIVLAEAEDVLLIDPGRLDAPHEALIALGFSMLGTFKLQDPRLPKPNVFVRQWVDEARCITCSCVIIRKILLTNLFGLKFTNTIQTTSTLVLGSTAEDGTIMMTHQDRSPLPVSCGFVYGQSVESTTSMQEMVKLHEAFSAKILAERAEALGRGVNLRPVSTIEQVREIEVDMQKRIASWRQANGYLAPEELTRALIGMSDEQQRAEMERLKYLRARDGFDTVLPVAPLEVESASADATKLG